MPLRAIVNSCDRLITAGVLTVAMTPCTLIYRFVHTQIASANILEALAFAMPKLEGISAHHNLAGLAWLRPEASLSSLARCSAARVQCKHARKPYKRPMCEDRVRILVMVHDLLQAATNVHRRLAHSRRKRQPYVRYPVRG